MLRCAQMGFLPYLDALEYGEVMDMFVEESNDHCEYKQRATQDDFDKF